MIEAVIKKLLDLQSYDRKIQELEELLQSLEPQKVELRQRVTEAKARLEDARATLKKTESEKKQLELEIETKKQLVQKYTLQQYQTKKNEEYRALAAEIENCNRAISELEDKVLELLYKIDELLEKIKKAQESLQNTEREVEQRLEEVKQREEKLQHELQILKDKRAQLATEIDPGTLSQYERIAQTRGRLNVVVGIERGICGGCHMQLPRQYIIRCQTAKELVFCPNCTRILYYTPDMNVVASG